MPTRDWKVAAAGAVGGALLAMVTNLVLEERKARHELRRDEAARIAAKEEQAASERRRTLEGLAASFDDLGDIVRRAVEHAETGKVGTPDDVRAVFRHLTRTMRVIRTDAASPGEVARYYGAGRIRGWGARFAALAAGSGPASKSFSAYERYNFRLLSDALFALADQAEPTDAYEAGSNTMIDSAAEDEGEAGADQDAAINGM